MTLSRFLAFLLTTSILLCSCDEGDIYPKSYDYNESMRIVVKANFKGYSSWQKSSGEQLALAAFGDSPYAIFCKNIVPDSDGNVDITLSGSSLSGVKSIEICLLGQLRDRIYTFESRQLNQSESSVEINLGDLDVSPLSAVENNIFLPTCAQCHGLSNSAARGVNLTPEKLNIVGKSSANFPEILIVEPGNHSNSLLYKMFTSDASANWRVDHKSFVQEPNLIKAIELWIDNAE